VEPAVEISNRALHYSQLGKSEEWEAAFYAAMDYPDTTLPEALKLADAAMGEEESYNADEPAAFAEDKPDGPAPAGDQFALAGHDGRQVYQLLAKSKRHGQEVLDAALRSAVHRMAEKPDRALKSKMLFNDRETTEVAHAFAAINSMAELLGRARMHERLRQQESFGECFSEAYPTDFSRFDEVSHLRPRAPRQALEYFKGLIPQLGIDPHTFAEGQQRHAFTLAGFTDETLLQRIQNIIRQKIQYGRNVHQAFKDVDEIVHEAGVTPNNPSRAEMIVRTNMMDAYNEGWSQEQAEPDMAEAFPVWRYSGIADGRERQGPLPKKPDHHQHFGKYFNAATLFGDVRGRDIGNAANCRCTGIGIAASEWNELQRNGAKVER
jgi:hypothetical protein